MIRKAMMEKVPQPYSELEESGKLEQFLEAHDAEMMRSFFPCQKQGMGRNDGKLP
jgi:hypothetical protein